MYVVCVYKFLVIFIYEHDQMVEETKRDDAVKAIVYEATCRVRDPVYGSAGIIFHLQKMVNELKSQLETTTTQALELQEQRDQLLGILMNFHYLYEFDTVPTMEHNMDDPVFDGCNSTHVPVSFPSFNDHL